MLFFLMCCYTAHMTWAGTPLFFVWNERSHRFVWWHERAHRFLWHERAHRFVWTQACSKQDCGQFFDLHAALDLIRNHFVDFCTQGQHFVEQRRVEVLQAREDILDDLDVFFEGTAPVWVHFLQQLRWVSKGHRRACHSIGINVVPRSSTQPASSHCYQHPQVAETLSLWSATKFGADWAAKFPACFQAFLFFRWPSVNFGSNLACQQKERFQHGTFRDAALVFLRLRHKCSAGINNFKDQQKLL